MISAPPVTIRPPWPDELSRVWKFLGRQVQLRGQVHPRIAVTGDPERIVAVAALQTDGETTGLLYLVARSRFCEGELAAQLLREIEAVARTEGLRKITLILPEAEPWRPLIESAGFVCQRTDEWWALQRDATYEERLRAAARLMRSSKITKGLSMRSLTPDDYSAVRAIAAEYGLASLERMGHERVLGRSGNEYDSDLSAVVCSGGEVAGILLVKNFGEKAFVHIRAVAKKYAAQSKAINAHLMAQFSQPQYQHICRIIFSAQPTVEKETIALAKRSGGKKIAAYCRYLKALQ